MKKKSAFTLIELLIIVGILAILSAIAVPTLRSFYRESDLRNSTEQIMTVLRLAQNRTLASQEADQWGVLFSTSSSQYTLFKGSSYALRDSGFDQKHEISQAVEINTINLAGGGQEVVFNRIIGTTDQFGDIALELKEDPLKTKKVFIRPSGKIVSSQEATSTDENRIKDSRHVHFDYSRQISTSSESIKLTFFYNGSSQTESFTLADHIRNGQIYWKGVVEVDGENQELKIHTHRFNDPVLGTQFCVHRDRRYNDKALKVEVSGDDSGDLIQYTAEGQTTKGSSIYVSTPIWQ